MTFDSLFQFESALADYTGAPYAVVTDGCTHAIELCLRWDRVTACDLTAYTYVSIPQLLRQLGIYYTMKTEYWTGEYQFHGTRIWDSARRLEPGMYRPGQRQCLSFGWDKPLSLGKCGAILLDDLGDYQVLSRMRSDGRDLRIQPWQDQPEFDQGYHYCPTIEVCEKGLEKLPLIQPQSQRITYPDCRKISFTT